MTIYFEFKEPTIIQIIRVNTDSGEVTLAGMLALEKHWIFFSPGGDAVLAWPGTDLLSVLQQALIAAGGTWL